MAKANERVANMFNALTFMILLLLLFSTLAQCQVVSFGSPSPSAGRELECLKVVKVRSIDSCFRIAKRFSLANDVFRAINPNLNCTALFVGQWICVDGTLS